MTRKQALWWMAAFLVWESGWFSGRYPAHDWVDSLFISSLMGVSGIWMIFTLIKLEQ